MFNGIVIPCFNESRRIDLDAFAAFVKQNHNTTICFVNDGSTDDTLQILKDFQNEVGYAVEVVNLKNNQGKAEAVRQGIQYLLNNTSVVNVGFMDADLSTGFLDYTQLLIELNNPKDRKSMVFASRKLGTEENINRSWFRGFVSQVFGFVIQIIIGLPIKDTQCGAKVFTRNMATQLFDKAFMSRWLFDVEIFLRMKQIFGAQCIHKLKEVAISKWEEVEGSKINLLDSLKFPFMLIKISSLYKTELILNRTQSVLERYQIRGFSSAA